MSTTLTEIESVVAAGIVMMSADEARAVVAQIRGHLEEARRALLDLYEREGYKALGYDSWRACVVAEFGQSAATLYRQLEAAQIERDVRGDSQFENSQFENRPIPTTHLQPLKDLPSDERGRALNRADELAGDGPRKAAHVEQAAAEIRDLKDAQRRYAALGWKLEQHGLWYKLSNPGGEHYATTPDLESQLQTLEIFEAGARKRAEAAAERPTPPAPTPDPVAAERPSRADEGYARRSRGALVRAATETLDISLRIQAHRDARFDAEQIVDPDLRTAVLAEIDASVPRWAPESQAAAAPDWSKDRARLLEATISAAATEIARAVRCDDMASAVESALDLVRSLVGDGYLVLPPYPDADVPALVEAIGDWLDAELEPPALAGFLRAVGRKALIMADARR
jgi:hypothetical protein